MSARSDLGARENACQSAHELAIIINDDVRREMANMVRRITEADSNTGYLGRLRSENINLAISDHYRPLAAPAGTLNCSGQVTWIGLAHCEGIAPGDGAEHWLEAKLA